MLNHNIKVRNLNYMNQLINWLGGLFSKAPALPAKAKEVIVKIAPWLALIGIVVSVPAVLALIGLGSYFSAYGYGMYSSGVSLAVIFAIALIVLNALAFPGLSKRTISGWNFSFYSVLVSAIQNILMGNIGSLIIGLAIGLYILFQVRSYYTGGVVMTPPPAAPQNPVV
jgi:hypothetical protein